VDAAMEEGDGGWDDGVVGGLADDVFEGEGGV